MQTWGSLPTAANPTSETNFKLHSAITRPKIRSIEPVGQYFLAYARRKRFGRTFSEDEKAQALATAHPVEESSDEGEENEETEDLLERDPKEWREQDHYDVLGLGKSRYSATDEQIKKAYRRKVLKHHPDKKARTGNVNDDSFFKCIQKAHEVVSDPVKRRQFDSVDEKAIVAPPSKKEQKVSYYKSWGRFFENEGRFSNKQPVPKFGDETSSKEQVEEFYEFWYNFGSWRTFEYLDKEPADDTDNRDSKRYQERKNKTDRAKRKTEDTGRLRKAIDTALAGDIRLKKFKDMAKAEREAKKKEAEQAAKKQKEDARNAARLAAQRKKAQEEPEEDELDDDAESPQEAIQAKLVAKYQPDVKLSIKKCNYFYDGLVSPQRVDVVLTDVDTLFAHATEDDLSTLVGKLKTLGFDDREAVRQAFDDSSNSLVSRSAVKQDDFRFFLSS